MAAYKYVVSDGDGMEVQRGTVEGHGRDAAEAVVRKLECVHTILDSWLGDYGDGWWGYEVCANNGVVFQVVIR